MTSTRKLALTSALFALTLVFVALSAATHSVAPLFVAWVPLAIVGFWVLSRPEPNGETLVGASAEAGSGEPSDQASEGSPDSDVTPDA